MSALQKNNCRSIFVLHVYAYSSPNDELAYCIDQDEIEIHGCTCPGFRIFESQTVYCTTLAEAEKFIKKCTKAKGKDIYGFVVEEKPLDCAHSPSDRLSVRRYLKNGKLWQKCEISSVREFFGADRDIGKTNFYGRDLKTIPFKMGDIVEVAGENFVELAIVWSLPPSVGQMKKIWGRFRARAKSEKVSIESAVHPDEADDAYAVVYYSVDKDGEIDYGHAHPATVDVLPPSLPVPRKIASELRRRLKMSQEEG